jgi:uridine phosphorylase
MQQIAESELIINARGAIYHLNLKPGELADTVITVGDPDRVSRVSKYFDRIETSSRHREFVSHTGLVGKKRLTVLSTGIGTDNIDIVLNELDALVNIDFETRTVKKNLIQLKIIRLGTAGSLQASIPVDSLVVSTHGLGIDNLLNFYRHEQNEEEKQLLHSFVTFTQMHNRFSYPYINSASASLIKHFVDGYHHGITVTCPGFYGPQGRVLRLGLTNPDLTDRLTQFQFGNHRIANFEMETAGIYGMGKILNHHCLSISAIVDNRITRQFTRDSQATVNDMILKTLEIVSGL